MSALANSSGGRLIIGLKEDERPGENAPVEIAPITDPAYRDQLIDTLVGRCLPAVAFDAVPIPIEGGGYCLVVEVEESLSPVMVSGKGQSRYYHRIDSKSLPMGEREVRERYSRMEARADVVHRLIDQAKPTRMIGAGSGDTPPWFTLLLVPMFSPVDIFDPAEFAVPVLHTVVAKARTEMPGRFLNARPTYQGLEWEALDGGGGYQFLLRLHRSGVFGYPPRRQGCWRLSGSRHLAAARVPGDARRPGHRRRTLRTYELPLLRARQNGVSGAERLAHRGRLLQAARPRSRVHPPPGRDLSGQGV